jgi:hypothetical protein
MMRATLCYTAEKKKEILRQKGKHGTAAFLHNLSCLYYFRIMILSYKLSILRLVSLFVAFLM